MSWNCTSEPFYDCSRHFGHAVYGLISQLAAGHDDGNYENARSTIFEHGSKAVWFQIGVHAANGIATVALTFTLFGISAGINQLAAGELNIDSVNAVITGLTSQFSMAFLTSVVGLPLSALMRMVVVVTGKQ